MSFLFPIDDHWRRASDVDRRPLIMYSLSAREQQSNCYPDEPKLANGPFARFVFLIAVVAHVLSWSAQTGTAAQHVRDSGITLGKLHDPNPGIQGAQVSTEFTRNHLQQFLQYLNSPEFHDELTNYNCGIPIPPFQFSVTLGKEYSDADSNSLSVVWNYTPNFSSFGTNRGLHAGLFYAAEKALAETDPGPHRFVLYRPILDCSKRGMIELWVKYSKTSEIFVAGKTPPPEVESEADKLAVLELPPLPLPRPEGKLVSREKSLGIFPEDAIRETLTVDQNFRHIAFVVKRGAKEKVLADGVEGKAYDSIARKNEMTFSPEGNRFAYVAGLGGKMLVVVDGKEGKLYDWIYDMFNPVFSPDGKHLAYVAGRKALTFSQMEEFVVIDGKELKHYATADTPVFSPDSRRFAYSAEKTWNRGMVVVADEKEQKTYHQIVGEVFSPDSKRLAYQAMTLKDPKAKRPIWDFAVIDGREELAYDYAGDPVFSPDSAHHAYKAVEMASNKPILVLDGAPLRCGKAVPDHTPCFSPDSQHLACLAHKERTWMILMDGKLLDKDVGEFTRGLTFSPDGGYLAYVSHGEGDSESSIVVNGHLLKAYEAVREGPKFSPDGKRLVYVISRAGKSVPVFGEFEGPEYDQFVHCDASRSTRATAETRSSFAFDERGILHAITLRNGEILQLELQIAE
jgi:hypothetical protein